MERIWRISPYSRLDSTRSPYRIRFRPLEKLPSEEILYDREELDPKRDRIHVERRSYCTLPRRRYQPYQRCPKKGNRPIQIYSGFEKGKRWNQCRSIQNGICTENNEIPSQGLAK